MKLATPTSKSEKQTRTTVDTVELTTTLVDSWKSPPFQRDFKANAKVLALAEDIKRDGGVLPGVLTLGALNGHVYVVDGQHRLKAWKMSERPIGYADIRTHFFESLGDMAKEFVHLNSSLVRLRPDDILRGLESSTVSLQRIRRQCPFIGYDMVRRGKLTKSVNELLSRNELHTAEANDSMSESSRSNSVSLRNLARISCATAFASNGGTAFPICR